jgi:hypothetical protein
MSDRNRIESGQGVSRTPTTTRFVPPQPPVMQRAVEILAGKSHNIKTAGPHVITPGGTGTTQFHIGTPEEIGGQVPIINHEGGAATVNLHGAKLTNGATSLDLTGYAGAFMWPSGQKGQWAVLKIPIVP